ncbi:MAG: septal ring lytic transglycosylase RlpA family protein [Gemmatimonadetes bacterium]|nr:septal ring lytic transglycosylase RlpA family protein [Gemmatimonadota bacterium]
MAVSACTLVGYPVGSPAAPVAPASPPPAPVEAVAADTSAAKAPDRAPADDPRGPPDFRRDGPPRNTRDEDLDTISDAVPREEPLAAYGNTPEYEVLGTVYRVMEDTRGYEEEGMASWYGEEFQGRRTSSGEPYDMYAMTAAHRTLPLPSYIEITNLGNGKRVVVRVNARGPFRGGRLIDVSYAAAHRLGMLGGGTARVRIRALQP